MRSMPIGLYDVWKKVPRYAVVFCSVYRYLYVRRVVDSQFVCLTSFLTTFYPPHLQHPNERSFKNHEKPVSLKAS
jgi:hypothetical protein